MEKLLACHHCKCRFTPSESQWNHRLERTITYCSDICRIAVNQLKKRITEPNAGPCHSCGKMFISRYKGKMFCNITCYHQSQQFRQMMRENSIKGCRTKQKNPLLKGTMVPCLECGKEGYVKPGNLGKNKYCSRGCYRLYLSKRFDRWIASPQEIGLLQNYDEFLSQDELQCLVEGCLWRGQHLGLHMNMTHGVTADQAKRAAGFNLGSGLVSADLSKFLSDRENIGVAIAQISQEVRMARLKKSNIKPRTYSSREGLEHRTKARCLTIEEGVCPIIQCLFCKKEFEQSTQFGKTLYCSVKCRSNHHKEKIEAKIHEMTCSFCNIPFKGDVNQKRRTERGMVIVCSLHCRNTMNAQRLTVLAKARKKKNSELLTPFD